MKVFWIPSLVLLYLFFGAIDSMGQGIRVESAYYGSRDGGGADVTERVQRFADYGEPFRVGNDTLRIDPSPNRPKTLVAVYYVDGRRISETVPLIVDRMTIGPVSESSGQSTAPEGATWMSPA